MQMTPQQWMTEPLKKYAQFTGRATRPEYWWFILFSLILSLVAAVIDRILGFGATSFGIVRGLLSLALLVPSLAVSFRRMHDIDRSAWWLLLGIIPFGGLVVLYWDCQPGTPGPNQYGPDPQPLI